MAQKFFTVSATPAKTSSICMQVTSWSCPNLRQTTLSSSFNMAWSTAHPVLKCGSKYDMGFLLFVLCQSSAAAKFNFTLVVPQLVCRSHQFSPFLVPVAPEGWVLRPDPVSSRCENGMHPLKFTLWKKKQTSQSQSHAWQMLDYDISIRGNREFFFFDPELVTVAHRYWVGDCGDRDTKHGPAAKTFTTFYPPSLLFAVFLASVHNRRGGRQQQQQLCCCRFQVPVESVFIVAPSPTPCSRADDMACCSDLYRTVLPLLQPEVQPARLERT